MRDFFVGSILSNELPKAKGLMMRLHLESAPWCRSPAAPIQPAMPLQWSVGCRVSPPRWQGPTCKMQKQLVPFSGTARGSRVGARMDGWLPLPRQSSTPERGSGCGVVVEWEQPSDAQKPTVSSCTRRNACGASHSTCSWCRQQRWQLPPRGLGQGALW